MIETPVTFLHITDTHLYADKEGSLLGVNTDESFQAVMQLIKNKKEKLDFIIHTGDISQDASQGSYLRVANALSELNVPIYWAPGNHDSLSRMSQIYPCANMSGHKHIILKNWHIILLDSHKSNAVEGYLDSAQLSYLQHCLQTYPEHHALVGFHHQPLHVGSTWLDNLGLKNAEEFWELLSHYPKMNTVLFGHVHQEFWQVKNNIKCIATPSTCIQFKPQQNKFALDPLPPGFRILHLFDDGSIKSEVYRVANYIGYFDKEAKGY